MRIYKSKVEKTIFNERLPMPSSYGAGYCVTVQAVYYSSKNPNEQLRLFDADGDEFMFRFPGQGLEPERKPNPSTPEIPVTVKLPLYYLDTGNDNEVIVWGEVRKIETALESSF